MNRSSVFHCRTLPLDDRVAELLSWFDGNPKDFPSFVTLYFEEPDKSGHSAGPVSDAVSHRVNNNSNISRRDLVVILGIVFTALIVSRVQYALPAWDGFLSSDLLNKIDSILRKAHKFGYTTEVLKVADMLQNADNKLFSLMFRSGHCLHRLLPDLKVTDIVLCNSSICLTAVINCTNSRLSICLFRDCY